MSIETLISGFAAKLHVSVPILMLLCSIAIVLVLATLLYGYKLFRSLMFAQLKDVESGHGYLDKSIDSDMCFPNSPCDASCPCNSLYRSVPRNSHRNSVIKSTPHRPMEQLSPTLNIKAAKVEFPKPVFMSPTHRADRGLSAYAPFPTVLTRVSKPSTPAPYALMSAAERARWIQSPIGSNNPFDYNLSRTKIGASDDTLWKKLPVATPVVSQSNDLSYKEIGNSSVTIEVIESPIVPQRLPNSRNISRKILPSGPVASTPASKVHQDKLHELKLVDAGMILESTDKKLLPLDPVASSPASEVFQDLHESNVEAARSIPESTAKKPLDISPSTPCLTPNPSQSTDDQRISVGSATELPYLLSLTSLDALETELTALECDVKPETSVLVTNSNDTPDLKSRTSSETSSSSSSPSETSSNCSSRAYSSKVRFSKFSPKKDEKNDRAWWINQPSNKSSEIITESDATPDLKSSSRRASFAKSMRSSITSISSLYGNKRNSVQKGKPAMKPLILPTLVQSDDIGSVQSKSRGRSRMSILGVISPALSSGGAQQLPAGFDGKTSSLERNRERRISKIPISILSGGAQKSRFGHYIRSPNDSKLSRPIKLWL